ncbi:MAG: hypothetical protein RIC51_11390 [Erythrobacter sp.]|uniref:hypothetical protein n=1 Tax=Erythrobacter sp. TaxID=1042 RepID=UPI0032EB87EE
MTRRSPIRLAAAALVAGLSLVLSGCFVSPGKFDSALLLGQDGEFTFTYDGEIFFLGLSGLSRMGAAAETFEPDCSPDECSEQEIAEQRAEWEANAGQRAAQAKQQAEQMSAMMGGIDPSDPEAAQELAQLLTRQKGWERVVPKGDGVFEVSYSISGTMDHDFLFPMIEGFPTTSPFVQFILRDGDVVRINAPAFAAQNDDNPMAAMMGGMGAMAGLAALGEENGSNEAPQMPALPQIEGTFSIVTKGGMKILANNTDEGANPTPTGEVLMWDISPRTKAAPTALVDLTP